MEEADGKFEQPLRPALVVAGSRVGEHLALPSIAMAFSAFGSSPNRQVPQVAAVRARSTKRLGLSRSAGRGPNDHSRPRSQ